MGNGLVLWALQGIPPPQKHTCRLLQLGRDKAVVADKYYRAPSDTEKNRALLRQLEQQLQQQREMMDDGRDEGFSC